MIDQSYFRGMPIPLYPSDDALSSATLLRIEQRLESLEAMLSALLDMLAQDVQEAPQAFDLSGQPIPRERGDSAPL